MSRKTRSNFLIGLLAAATAFALALYLTLHIGEFDLGQKSSLASESTWDPPQCVGNEAGGGLCQACLGNLPTTIDVCSECPLPVPFTLSTLPTLPDCVASLPSPYDMTPTELNDTDCAGIDFPPHTGPACGVQCFGVIEGIPYFQEQQACLSGCSSPPCAGGTRYAANGDSASFYQVLPWVDENGDGTHDILQVGEEGVPWPVFEEPGLQDNDLDGIVDAHDPTPLGPDDPLRNDHGIVDPCIMIPCGSYEPNEHNEAPEMAALRNYIENTLLEGARLEDFGATLPETLPENWTTLIDRNGDGFSTIAEVFAGYSEHIGERMIDFFDKIENGDFDPPPGATQQQKVDAVTNLQALRDDIVDDADSLMLLAHSLSEPSLEIPAIGNMLSGVQGFIDGSQELIHRVERIVSVVPGLVQSMIEHERLNEEVYGGWSFSFVTAPNGTVGVDLQYYDKDGNPIDPSELRLDGPSEGVVAKSQATADDPVRTNSGEYTYRTTDLSLPGRANGMGLQLDRIYGSRQSRRGWAGWNWSMPLLDTFLALWPDPENTGDPRLAQIYWGDGHWSMLTEDLAGLGEYHWEGIAGEFGKLRFYFDEYEEEDSCPAFQGLLPGGGAAKGLEYRRPDGTRYLFCLPTDYPLTAGKMKVCWLRKIVDPHGNAIVLRRLPNGAVYEIVDTLHRTVSLEYYDGHQLLKRITHPDGGTIDYAYDLDQQSLNYHSLTQVDYPERLHLDDQDTIQLGRPFELYTYDQNGEGLHEPLLNYNLTEIYKSDLSSPFITVTYGQGSGYSFDRVESTTRAGQSTLFEYEKLGSGPNGAVHKTEVHFSDGAVESFLHDDDGFLVRFEVDNNCNSNAGTGSCGGCEPSALSVTSWITEYEYNDDGLLTRVLETNDIDWPDGRVVEQEYYSWSTDRFAQRNLFKITHYPDSSRLNKGWRSSISTQYAYEPVTNRVTFEFDEGTGRATRYQYGHQEMSQAQASADPLVAGWGIELDPGPWVSWDQGDMNQDAMIGGTYHRVRTEFDLIDIADHDGKGYISSEEPTRLFVYRFDGQIHKVVDVTGTVDEYHYACGLLHHQTRDADPAGLNLTTTYEYDAVGRMTQTIEPDGTHTHYRYDGASRLVEARYTGDDDSATDDILSQVYYDLKGNLVAWRDRRFAPSPEDPLYDTYVPGVQPPLSGRSFFDSANRETRTEWSIFDPAGQLLETASVAQAYNGRGLVCSSVGILGAIKTYVYDPRGLLIKTSRTDSSGGIDYGTFITSRDKFGDVVAVSGSEDADNDTVPDTTTFVLDGYGRLTETHFPSGEVQHLTLDWEGRPTQSTTLDALGNTVQLTDFTYDIFGRTIQEDHAQFRLNADGSVLPLIPSTTTVSFGYGARGNELRWVKTSDGTTERIVRHSYDALGRQIATFYGAGPATDIGELLTLDPMGRVLTRVIRHDSSGNVGTVNPSESRYDYDYSDFGHIEAVTRPDLHVVNYETNAWGNATKTILPNGLEIDTAYDSVQRARTVTETRPGGTSRSVQYSCNALGATTQVLDQKLNPTTYHYDDIGRLERKVFSDATEIRHFYDRMDRRVRTEQPDGSIWTFKHDTRGNMTLLTAAAPGKATIERTIAYDPFGRANTISESIDSASPRVVTIDRSTLGHTLSETNGTKSFDLDHNGLGELLSITYDSGYSVSYGRDSLGRVDTVADASGSLANYTLYGFRGYTEADLNGPGNLRVEQDFDQVGRITRKVVRRGQSLHLAGSSFQYDPVGNPTQRTRWKLGQQSSETYGYDDFDRLTGWSATIAGQPRTYAWTYDLADNLRTFDDGSSPPIDASANGLNQLTAATPAIDTFSYDNSGHETIRANGSSSTGREWDALGRLVRATLTGGTTIDWKYDGLDRLVKRTDSLGGFRTFRYAAGLLLESGDINAGLRDYAYGAGGELLSRHRALNDQHYFHVTPLGNVEAIFDPQNLQQIEAYCYEPYGRPLDPVTGTPYTSSPLGNDLLFLAQPYDFTLGISQLGARQYDPQLGRFLERDPLGEAGGLNLYSYANANPMRWRDPSGLSPESHHNRESFDSRSSTGSSPGRSGGFYGPAYGAIRDVESYMQDWRADIASNEGPSFVGSLEEEIGNAIDAFKHEIAKVETYGVDGAFLLHKNREAAKARSLHGLKLTLGELVSYHFEVSYSAWEESVTILAESMRVGSVIGGPIGLLSTVTAAGADLALGNGDRVVVDVLLGAAGQAAGKAFRFLDDAWGARRARKLAEEPKCFVAGTLVHTPDGLVPIEEIEAGDRVVSYDVNSGSFVTGCVLRTAEKPYAGEMVTVVVSGASVVVTADHPFLLVSKEATADNQWVPAKKLRAGDNVLSIERGFESVERVRLTSDDVKVFNLEVGGYHNYLVSCVGIVVHNSCYVDLTAHRRDHILNRHRAGANKPNKTEFPQGWSDDRIMHEVSDIATDPNATWGLGKWDSPYAIGIRGGIEIRVDFYPVSHTKYGGMISTAYPVKRP